MSDEISFISTGDPIEDEKIANSFRLHTERMQNNICPNGCGQMNWIDPHNRTCPKCEFAGFSTKPYDMKAGNS